MAYSAVCCCIGSMWVQNFTFYVSPQTVKCTGAFHYTDILIEKLLSTGSPLASLLYIKDNDNGIPIMVIKLKKVTSVQLIDVVYKDMMEMACVSQDNTIWLPFVE